MLKWNYCAAQSRWGRLIALALALLLAACLPLAGCSAGGDKPAGDGGVRVLVDGEPWSGEAILPGEDDGLRVYITLDGEALVELPFAQRHTVRIIQPETGENTVEITGTSVYMAHADCENQDCVQMGAVTRENLEMRVMGGFIVCLPHRISVEVRGE